MQLTNVSESVRAPVLEPQQVCSALQPFGLRPARPDAIQSARDWTAKLIGPSIAPPQALGAVHQLMGEAAVFVRSEAAELVGVLGWIALSQSGLQALVAGRFCAQDPDPDHVCRPGQSPSACYGWGIAGSTPEGAKAVVCATQVLYLDVYPGLPWFTRAATEDGRRVILGRFGYQPAPVADGGLLWRPAERERAA